MMQIGKSIRKLRLDRGITQEALADAMHVSPQSVSKWETGTTTPDIALLPKLAVYFGVSMDTLFSLTQDEYLDRITAMLRDEHTISPGDFLWAEGYLTGLLAENPDYNDARKRLVWLYRHRVNRDTLTCGRIAEEGIRRDPMDVELVKALVQIREQRQERDRLISFLAALAEADPDSYVVREELIEACIRNREWERAEKLMTGVPSRPAYTLFRGDILLAKGDEDGAVKIWTELADSLIPQEKTDGGLAAWTYYQAAERLNGIGRGRHSPVRILLQSRRGTEAAGFPVCPGIPAGKTGGTAGGCGYVAEDHTLPDDRISHHRRRNSGLAQKRTGALAEYHRIT